MADFNLSAISNVLVDMVAVEKAKLEAQPSDLFDLLYSRRQRPSGHSGPKWTAQNSKMSGATFSSGGDYPAPQNLTWIRPEMPAWGKYVLSVAFDKATLTAIAISGASYAGQLMAQAVSGAFGGLREDVNDDLLSNDSEDAGGDENGVTGIPGIVSASNTFAGVDRSTETLWQAYINSTGGAVTKAKLDDVHKAITHTRRKQYTHVIGGPDLIEDVLALSEVTNTDPNRMAGPDAGRDGILGMRKLNLFAPLGYYNQRPVIEWPGWTGGRIDFLNLDHLSLEVAQDLTLESGGMVKVPGKDRYVLEYTLLCQTKYRDPRTAGALTGLTT